MYTKDLKHGRSIYKMGIIQFTPASLPCLSLKLENHIFPKSGTDINQSEKDM